MQKTNSNFLGRVALHATVACLLALGNGCRTEVEAPGDLTGSGGSGSTSGGGGTQTGVGGEVGSGGAPAGGSGSSDAGGSPSGGGSLGSGGDPASGGNGGSSGGAGGAGGGPTFSLTSPAFDNVEGCSTDNVSVCDVIPDENVSYMGNANLSPELHWMDPPAGTQSFALVLFDVTFGQAHWVLWNIPADATMLAADVPDDTKLLAVPAGSEQANANFATTSEDGYFGPHLPCNVFEFQLYALSVSPFSPTSSESSVLISIQLQDSDEVLGVARLTGRAADYDATCQ